MFKGIIFDTNCCSFPYSENVEDALNRLTMSKLFSLIDLEAYEVTTALAKKDAKELFIDDECKILKKISEIFQKEVGAWLPEWHKDYKMIFQNKRRR